MQRRTFCTEFEFEVVGVVRERGVAVAQSARLDVRECAAKMVHELLMAPQCAFPGPGR